MFEATLAFLIVGIERFTQIFKPYFKLNPIVLSMIIGTLLGIASFPALSGFSIFADKPLWVLLVGGGLFGLACSLPANILHDIWQLIKDLGFKSPDIDEIVKKIEETKNK